MNAAKSRASADSGTAAPVRVAVLPLVVGDLQGRVLKGRAEYGESLTTRNGRDALRDAYEEALDLVLYLRQAIEERDG